MNFRHSDKHKVGATIDMTPFIDVVFQLIIFFMLTGTFVLQSSIQIQVPKAEGSVALEQKDLSITLLPAPGGPDDKGRVYVDMVEIQSIPELSRVLAAAHSERPDLMVLVRADASVQTARLVEVLGIASSVGIERYGILAQPPSEDK